MKRRIPFLQFVLAESASLSNREQPCVKHHMKET